MKIKAIPAAELSPQHLSQWSMLQQSNPELASPYFCPEFTVAVASVRPDVYVAVLEDAGQAVGFFPFQRNRLGIGKPVGGALSDYHGVIGVKNLRLDPRELLHGCDLVCWDFDHLSASQELFQEYHRTIVESHIMDLSGGFASYVSRLRENGSKLLKQTNKSIRRLERHIGPLRFCHQVNDIGVLRTLLRWKSAQYRRFGLVDVFNRSWTVKLLEQIHSTSTDDFSGMLSALYADDELLAVHMGMRSRTVWHWWFPSHNPEHLRYSPGIVLRLRAAQCAESIGIKIIDMGKGDTSHKFRFRTGTIKLAEGRVEVPSLTTTARKLYRNTEAWVRRTPLVAVARVPGRVIKRAERSMRFR